MTDEKEIYNIGEMPPLGYVPNKMHAWVIRKDRHGNPMQSFKEEEFPVPEIGPNEVLIFVMAAGVNYNGVWAGLGVPVSVLDMTKKDYHIAGSDASGIVWKVGSDVKKWKVGDRVVSETAAIIDNESPLTKAGLYNLDPTRKGFGYGVDGAMTKYVRTPARCLHHIPENLSFEEACLTEPCCVAYNAVVVNSKIKPGDKVLVIGPGTIGILCAVIAKICGADVSFGENVGA